MIRLLELYPDHLNLNGDRGNLVVLQRRLEWAEIEVTVSSYQVGDSLGGQAPDFVLLGHGSPAAWRQIYADLARIAPTLQTWIDGSTQMLAVSSGFAALHGLLRGLPSEVNKVPRISKFEVAELADEQIVGYKNTDLDLPTIERFGNLVGTVLHGPLLVKNPKLSEEILSGILGNSQSENFELSEPLKNYVEDARELAIELSSE
jgi:lipid II isoglutaminyl synthase (glutamine-hydrolysing)